MPTCNSTFWVHQIVDIIVVELITANVIEVPPTGVDKLCALEHGGRKRDTHCTGALKFDLHDRLNAVKVVYSKGAEQRL